LLSNNDFKIFRNNENLSAFGETFWMGGMLLSVFGHEHDNLMVVNLPMKTWAYHSNTNSYTLKLGWYLGLLNTDNPLRHSKSFIAQGFGAVDEFLRLYRRVRFQFKFPLVMIGKGKRQ
jgi:hypothetical protein